MKKIAGLAFTLLACVWMYCFIDVLFFGDYQGKAIPSISYIILAVELIFIGLIFFSGGGVRIREDNDDDE